MDRIPIFAQFVQLLIFCLEHLATWTGSPGLAIIIFTVLIKLILTPLTLKTIKSQRAMQELQPKIKALQKRHGDDRQKLSAETMRLYQAHNVNPTASCLPVVFQLPIFWGLYTSLTTLAHTAGGPFQQSFLWLPSLAQADALHIMPFVAAVFQLIQTRMSMPTGKYKPTDPQQKMMSQMMQFLPLSVIIFGWGFPSGLVLYWATQSIYGAVQQYFITGWGGLREWIPFLPEVSRWTPPDPDAIDESKVIVAGEDGARPTMPQKGFWGLISKQMERVEQQRLVTDGSVVEGKVGASSATKATGDTSKPANGARPRVAVQNSTKSARRRNADELAPEELETVEDEPQKATPTPRISVRKTTSPASDGK